MFNFTFSLTLFFFASVSPLLFSKTGRQWAFVLWVRFWGGWGGGRLVGVGGCMHGNKCQAGVGGRDTGEKGGGVSGVWLGDDGTLTSRGRFKQGGDVYKMGGGGRYTALAGVGTVSEHCRGAFVQRTKPPNNAMSNSLTLHHYLMGCTCIIICS